MTGADAGFALFLGTLLLAPSVPVPNLGNANVSPAAGALLLWFMLAPRLPVLAPLRLLAIQALILFAVYAFLVSCISGRPVAFAYGAQWLFYAVAAGCMVPAYLLHKARHGRLADAWHIVAWITGVYAAGIVVSLWYGPIYPEQIGAYVKHYGDVGITRGVGFSEGANVAGGIMAVLTAFMLLVYRPGGRFPLALGLLSIAALFATMSRSAVLAFMTSAIVFGVIVALRIAGLWPVARPRIAALTAFGIAVIAAVAIYQHPIGAAAWERLVLDQSELQRDYDNRFEHWARGLEAWATKPVHEQLLGSGHRSRGLTEETGAYASSHNGYIDILNDLGVVGLLFFGAILVCTLARAAYLVLVGGDAKTQFSLAALVILDLHNFSQLFWYGPAVLALLICALALNGLVARRPAD